MGDQTHILQGNPGHPGLTCFGGYWGLCPQTPEIYRFGPIAWYGQEGDAPHGQRRHATGPLRRSGCFSAEPYPPQRQGQEYPGLISCASNPGRVPPTFSPAAPGRPTTPVQPCRVALPSCYWRKAKNLPRTPLWACLDCENVLQPDKPESPSSISFEKIGQISEFLER